MGFNLLAITITLLVLYMLGIILVKNKKLSIVAHRKFWNILLLISFLVLFLTGLILMLKVEFGIIFNLPFSSFFWHIESGIAMLTIAVFHALWHWDYFKSLI